MRAADSGSLILTWSLVGIAAFSSSGVASFWIHPEAATSDSVAVAERRLLSVLVMPDPRAPRVPTWLPGSAGTYGVVFSDGGFAAPGAVGGADNSGRIVNVSPS